jgi:DNA-binding CsgD family transcriptional regulator
VTELLSTSISPLGKEVLLSFDHAIEIAESDLLVAILRQAISEAFGDLQPEAAHWSQLSPRELEIAQLIAQNCSNKEIAGALLCSVNTVKRHVTSIMKKLRVLDRNEVKKWWAQRP